MGGSISSGDSICLGASRYLSKILVLSIVLLSTVSCVGAYDMEASHGVYKSPFFEELAKNGQIHIDHRQPPAIPKLNLVARSPIVDSSSISTMTSTGASRPTSSSGSMAPISVATRTSSSTSSTASSTSTSSDVPTALPTPFDTSLGINFTSQACPTFFNTFINNATFKSCLPVSLLLQNSIGFFKATRSASFLDTVLDAACSASLAICSPLMADIADDLLDDANCGADYRRQNPIVLQAYSGLLAYEPLYTATCLPNKATGNYCFVDAVVNVTNAADVYPYYTALGITLPSSAQPSCSSCLQQTMNIFAGYAGQKNQPLARTYLSCATQIDKACGASFASTDVKVAVDSSKKSAASKMSMSVPGLVISASVLSWTFLL